MLANVKLTQPDFLIQLLKTVIDDNKEIENPYTGVYLNTAFNFGHMVEEGYLIDIYADEYGVADNVEQVLRHYDNLVVDKDNYYCIAFTQINKHDEPAQGGWRWHKWGEYIGIKNPQCEYIHDEPEIESVVCFSIYQVNPDKLQ